MALIIYYTNHRHTIQRVARIQGQKKIQILQYIADRFTYMQRRLTSVAHAVAAFHLILDCTPVDVPDCGQRKEAHQHLQGQTVAPEEDASPTMGRSDRSLPGSAVESPAAYTTGPWRPPARAVLAAPPHGNPVLAVAGNCGHSLYSILAGRDVIAADGLR